ncbi:MAG: AtpZ/AtpI family protein [bacterium]|nr:AtpZ/AtpI family protein [bacterium]
MAWAEELKEISRYLTLVTQIGLMMVSSVFIGLGAGYYLDKWFGTGLPGFALFIILGVAGGGLSVYRLVMEQFKKED